MDPRRPSDPGDCWPRVHHTISSQHRLLPSSPALTLNTALAPPGDPSRIAKSVAASSHDVILAVFVLDVVLRGSASVTQRTTPSPRLVLFEERGCVDFMRFPRLKIFLAPPAHGAVRLVPASWWVAVPLSKTLSTNDAPATANRSWAPCVEALQFCNAQGLQHSTLTLFRLTGGGPKSFGIPSLLSQYNAVAWLSLLSSALEDFHLHLLSFAPSPGRPSV